MHDYAYLACAIKFHTIYSPMRGPKPLEVGHSEAKTLKQSHDNDPLQLSQQLCFALYVDQPFLHPGLQAPAGAPGAYLSPISGHAGAVEMDGITVKEIGARLQLDSGTLTPLLKRLDSAGLITRSRDSGDERQVRIALTDAGRILRAKAEGIPKRLGEVIGAPSTRSSPCANASTPSAPIWRRQPR